VNAAQSRAVRRLLLDAALAEIVPELRARNVESLLLKGPAVARRLYERPEERGYGDIDLLVPPTQFAAAQWALHELGFRDRYAGARASERSHHHDTFQRSRGPAAIVELHRTLRLVPASHPRVWDLLSADAVRIEVAGVTVDTPAPAALGVIVALHAAQHGVRAAQPVRDLTLALERIQPEDWAAAADLARGLNAEGSVAEGLRLLPRGAELAVALGLPERGARFARLGASSPSATSWGIEHLFTAGSTRARLRLVADKLAPSPVFMRGWQPIARRGLPGLILAYAWRPFWLAAKLRRGSRDWFRAAFPSGRNARVDV
jgi:hypothetical protein